MAWFFNRERVLFRPTRRPSERRVGGGRPGGARGDALPDNPVERASPIALDRGGSVFEWEVLGQKASGGRSARNWRRARSHCCRGNTRIDSGPGFTTSTGCYHRAAGKRSGPCRCSPDPASTGSSVTGGGHGRAGAVSRVYYIDWLRILAVLLLFPFHTLRVFNNEALLREGVALSRASPTGSSASSRVWHMPLLFFLAGCSTYFALRKRTAGQYAWERVKRLLVPLVFGILILIPPQTWYGARFNSGYAELVLALPVQRRLPEVEHPGRRRLLRRLRHRAAVVHPLAVLHLTDRAAPGRCGPCGGGSRARVQRLSRRLSHPAWWLVPDHLPVHRRSGARAGRQASGALRLRVPARLPRGLRSQVPGIGGALPLPGVHRAGSR